MARAHRMGVNGADFLVVEAIDEITERLDATCRDFAVALDILSPTHSLATRLMKLKNIGNVDIATQDQDLDIALQTSPVQPVNLISSIFGLHWQSDIKGTLLSIHKHLSPDGLFIAAVPGSSTLSELRASLLEAEAELTGSAALRVEPFGEVRQYGNMLQETGFALPVADTVTLTVRYDDMFGLIRDLRAMAATNSLKAHPGKTPRNLFEVANQKYREKFSDPDGRIRASFEIIYLAGWKPHPSQQKPLEPGSAKNKLSDFL